MRDERLLIIGGGLAGSEAVWQAAHRGVPVTLFEMKPKRFSEAHHSPLLGELVCSNSLKSEALETAPGLLKDVPELLGRVSLAGDGVTRHQDLPVPHLGPANALGVGPMGFGGETTVLGVKIGALHRLPASYFVTASYMCWADRRRTLIWRDGEVEIN